MVNAKQQEAITCFPITLSFRQLKQTMNNVLWEARFHQLDPSKIKTCVKTCITTWDYKKEEEFALPKWNGQKIRNKNKKLQLIQLYQVGLRVWQKLNNFRHLIVSCHILFFFLKIVLELIIQTIWKKRSHSLQTSVRNEYATAMATF